jgi:hypothetical protein
MRTPGVRALSPGTGRLSITAAMSTPARQVDRRAPAIVAARTPRRACRALPRMWLWVRMADASNDAGLVIAANTIGRSMAPAAGTAHLATRDGQARRGWCGGGRAGGR